MAFGEGFGNGTRAMAVMASVIIHVVIVGLFVICGGNGGKASAPEVSKPATAEKPDAPAAAEKPPAPVEEKAASAAAAKMPVEDITAPERPSAKVSGASPATGKARSAPRREKEKERAPSAKSRAAAPKGPQDNRQETSLEDALDTTELVPVKKREETPAPTPVKEDAGETKPAATGAVRWHRVKAGENLTRLARECGCTQADLARLNGTDVRTLGRLRVGQRIKLPAAPAGEATRGTQP